MSQHEQRYYDAVTRNKRYISRYVTRVLKELGLVSCHDEKALWKVVEGVKIKIGIRKNDSSLNGVILNAIEKVHEH